MIIKGVIANTGVDPEGQRLDVSWLERELPRWFHESGMVTVNFTGSPVARCYMLDTIDGEWVGKVEVLDDKTAQMIRANALRGLSISIKNTHVDYYQNSAVGVIDGGHIIRVSLIDKPFYTNDNLEILYES